LLGSIPPIRLRLFFAGFEGVFMGLGLWEVKMFLVQVMGVTLVYKYCVSGTVVMKMVDILLASMLYWIC
jgi:hypothetical protein